MTVARHGKPWTREEDDSLLMLARRGEALEWIAEVHGRTPVAIRYRLEHLQNPRTAVARCTPKPSPGNFERWAIPSRTFPNRFTNTCRVCGQPIECGADAHFVAADQIAHATCF